MEVGCAALLSEVRKNLQGSFEVKKSKLIAEKREVATQIERGPEGTSWVFRISEKSGGASLVFQTERNR